MTVGLTKLIPIHHLLFLCFTEGARSVLDALVETIQVPQSFARWLDLLGLQSSFNDIQWISYYACYAASDTGADEIPQVWLILLPRLDESLEVLVDANDDAHERHIHQNRKWVGTVEAKNALVLHYIAYTPTGFQVLAQLHSLFDYISRGLEEVVGERARRPDHHR